MNELKKYALEDELNSKRTPEACPTIWPPEDYYRQLEYLKKKLNQAVYIVPIHQNQNSLTFSMNNKSIRLIAIIDYPLPDPENHIFPHMLVFDDGTGINLGRVARVSINHPFNPGKKDIIYADEKLVNSLMLKDRQLSNESIRLTSKHALGEILSIAQNDAKRLMIQLKKSDPLLLHDPDYKKNYKLT
jgi:hypothetical protein